MLHLRVFSSSLLVLIAFVVGFGLVGCGGGSSPSALSQPGSGVSAATRPATQFLVFFAGFDASSRAPHRLEVVDRHGSVLRVLSTAHSGTFGRWSSNGAMIGWKDPSGIYVENADGSQRRRLVASSACEGCQSLSFIWSPDSRSLIVGSAGPKGNELLLVPIDGGAANVLASSATSGVFYTPVRWTPDGRSLVYDESGTTLAFPGTFMRVLTLATGRTRTVWSTTNSQGGHPPLISPDDRKRAYITEVDQYHQRLRIVDAVTGKSHVVAGVNPTNFVAWSPNSRALAVVEWGGHVVTVTADGRQVRKIGPGEQVTWGRNGELFIQRADYNQVWVSENGGPETFLFHVPKGDFVFSMDAD
jgi:Tol biopolymer transport system component